MNKEFQLKLNGNYNLWSTIFLDQYSVSIILIEK